MPQDIRQYRVFIGSPGGLNDERKAFREKLYEFSDHHCFNKGLMFYPVGWEDTLGGVGRPQALINQDLETCDYAVFILHDRWGSPPGSIYTSGTEEEIALAEELYKRGKILNILFIFKNVSPSQLKDPGVQLKAVLEFKAKIEREKKYLFKPYKKLVDFRKILDQSLGAWKDQHERAAPVFALNEPVSLAASHQPAAVQPDFQFWFEKAKSIINAKTDYHSALFCAREAFALQETELEWTDSQNIIGIAQFYLGNMAEAISVFDSIAAKFKIATTREQNRWLARALVNKGITLGNMGRDLEAIKTYDEVVVRFQDAPELTLRAAVAMALFNKGVNLTEVGLLDVAIKAYDEVISRFQDASELALREQVAKALVNKGVDLAALGQRDAAIKAYDELIFRFKDALEPYLREAVANALINKGIDLAALGQRGAAFKSYDDVISRFQDAPELALREQVAKALVNKGAILADMGQYVAAIKLYDEVISRFQDAPELALREQVAMALFNKGNNLADMGQREEAIKSYDEVISRFQDAPELVLRELVKKAENLKNFLKTQK